jgi:hypothetical protein
MAPTVTTRTVTSAGQTYDVSSDYLVTEPVRGGIYIGGNGDWRPDFTGVNIKSFTGYHSMNETGPSIYPGQTWRADLVNAGLVYNLVVELKVYGGNGGAAATITVEGKTYQIPTANMKIQRRDGVGVLAYSYDQMTGKQLDGLLHRILVELRKVPSNGRVNVQFASEIDTDNEFGVQIGNTVYSKADADAKALAAITYAISWMKNPPTGIARLGSNITFSMGWAGSAAAWSGFDSFQRTHPDSLPVDFMQWNVYNHEVAMPAAGQEQHPYQRLMEMIGLYRRLGPGMRKKNIIIAEWGTSKYWPGGQAAYIDEWAAAVRRVNAEQLLRGEGQIVMTNYFASRDATWGTLDPKQAGIDALGRAYNSPPFR